MKFTEHNIRIIDALKIDTYTTINKRRIQTNPYDVFNKTHLQYTRNTMYEALKILIIVIKEHSTRAVISLVVRVWNY